MLRTIERVLPAPLGDRVVTLLRQEGTAGTAAKGSIAAFVTAAVGMLISFVTQVTLTRALGATEYGTYVVVLVGMNVALLFTKIELDIVTTRFVGAYAATGDWPRLHGLLRLVPRQVLLRTLIVGSIGVAVLWALRGSRFEDFVIPAVAAFPLFVLTAQLLVRSAALQGFKRVLASQISLVVLRPIVFLVSVWLLMAFSVRLAPASAIGLNAVGTMVALLFAQRALRRTTPDEARHAPATNDMPAWLRVGYGFVAISAAQLSLSQQSDILLVAALLGRTESAYYSAASQLAMLVVFASTAVMLIVAPLISEMYAMQKLDLLRRFTRATVSICIVISFILLVAIAGFGRLLLGAFGSAFTVAYPALLLLALSQFVTASVGALSGWLMTMTGHERPAAWMIGGSAVLNIALAIPFTMRYGIAGTASATLITTLLRSVVLSVFLRRRLGLLVVPGFGRASA